MYLFFFDKKIILHIHSYVTPNTNIVFKSLKKRTDRLKDQADHTVEGLWRAAKQVFDEYPREFISIEYGQLY